MPRRRHRRFTPYVDRDSGQPADLSAKEVAAQAKAQPLIAVVRALAVDEPFLEGIDAIREWRDPDGPDLDPSQLSKWLGRFKPNGQEASGATVGEAFAVDKLARRYVSKEGRGLRAMRRLIEVAVASGSNRPMNILGAASIAVPVEAPLVKAPASKGGDPKEWNHARQLPEAATMLSRLGQGHCIACGGQLAEADRGRRRYCSSHQNEASLREERDRKAIGSLLLGVADALSVE